MTAIISMMNKKLPEPFDRLPPGAAVPFRLGAGEALFRAHDTSQGCYLLDHGEMRLVRWSGDGRETVIHVARAGEIFAEAALFSRHYHCDAVASAEASGHLLRKAAVDGAFRTSPLFARAFAARLARQVQELRRRVEIIAIRSAGDRVMAGLGQYENPDTGEFAGLPPLKLLAAQIGLTHEALYRGIARLVRDGRLVKVGRGRVRLPAAIVDKRRNSD